MTLALRNGPRCRAVQRGAARKPALQHFQTGYWDRPPKRAAPKQDNRAQAISA